ncbi:hypothetical protein [Methylobacterium oryzae]|uniref:Uncharacterized protein n=1 Tax=Methylobacterium oryzae TaxID=334852 RepID=A0ABU7TTT0_9HYPH
MSLLLIDPSLGFGADWINRRIATHHSVRPMLDLADGAAVADPVSIGLAMGRPPVRPLSPYQSIPESTVCQVLKDRAMLVRDACIDDISILALSLVRFVASGYMTGDVTCWEAAHDIAERALGAADGTVFVAAMTGVMRAIRADRPEDWSFMPASCCRLTPAEEQLVCLLAAARVGEAAQLAQVAWKITGGAAPRLRAAACLAADLMERHASFSMAHGLEPERQSGRVAARSAPLH